MSFPRLVAVVEAGQAEKRYQVAVRERGVAVGRQISKSASGSASRRT